MIYLLFGEMGAGKNHVGELMAQQLGCEFFDGDTVIPEHMLQKVLSFKLFSASDLDQYVRLHLLPAIQSRHVEGQDLVVAQALYRREHRDIILNHQPFQGQITPVWITVPSFFTHKARLVRRKQGFHWLLYWLACKPFFQQPPKGTARIANGLGNDLTGQIRQIIDRRKEERE